MKITLIQTDLLWNDPAGNRARFEQKIAEAGSADLIVLPEMFSTGFCTQPRLAAEPLGGETLPWMKRIAQKTDCALAGSVAVEENGNYFNRFYFVKPDGSVSQYDKRHLFTYGGEHKEFTAGDKRVIVEYKGWRILLQICYDLRFPVWSRNRNDYDLAIYTANWPTPRVDAWSALLRARAAAAGITEIAQKGGQLQFTLETLDFAAVSGVCAEPDFHNKVFFSAGSVPKLTWKLGKNEDPLKAAQQFTAKFAAYRAS